MGNTLRATSTATRSTGQLGCWQRCGTETKTGRRGHLSETVDNFPLDSALRISKAIATGRTAIRRGVKTTGTAWLKFHRDVFGRTDRTKGMAFRNSMMGRWRKHDR